MNAIIQSILHHPHPQLPLAYLQDAVKTYAAFINDVSIMTQRLQQQPSQRWALWQDSSYEFSVNFFALLLAQKTVVLPPNRVDATRQTLAAEQIAFWDGLSTDSSPFQAQAWPTLDAEHSQIVLFTSGSTGTPKHIARTFAQLSREIETLTQVFPWQAQSCISATVSHQHLYGLCYKILLPLRQNCAFIDAQCHYPEDVQTLPKLPPAHILISSPAFLSRWQHAAEAARFQAIFSSGGPLSTATAHELQRDIIEIFGSSETGGIAWRLPSQAWRLLPDVAIRTDAEQRLWVQAAHAYSLDWLSTGDAALIQDAGTGFELQGRMDRMIKLEEKRLSLDAIEAVLKHHAAITDAHVCVLPWGNKQQLAAAVSLTAAAWQRIRAQGKLMWVRQLKRELANQLESMALPKRWRLVPSLPRNSQSKLDQQTVSQLFAPRNRPEFQIIQQDQHSATVTLWFAPELLCFKGHFPSLPIYPGVAQIDCVQYLARLTLLPRHLCVGMEQLKFQQPIRPYDAVTLQLERKADKVHFKLCRDNTILASGRLCFQECTL